MEDLVLPRELIRTPESKCSPLSINRVFSHLGMEEIPDCAPCSPIAIALCLSHIGVKSINARARSGKDVLNCSKWCTRRLNTPIHLDVSPTSFSTFRNAVGRLFALARQTSAKLKMPDMGDRH